MVEFDIKLERFRDQETGRLISGKMFKNLGHAVASIAKDAKRSIKTSAVPSPVGTAPHTRKGLLRRAIRYELDRARKSAAIGPTASLVGEAGRAMEFGGRFRNQDYPARPYMAPALERNQHRLGGQMAGRIGG